MEQREGLQEWTNATLIRPASSHAEADGADGMAPMPLLPSGRVILPWLDQEKGNPLRIAVVDRRGVALMPCTPAKARIVQALWQILPLTDAVVGDVQAVTHKGKGGKWNQSFSPVQVGKEHLSRLLREMGLSVHLREGWQTKALREQYGLKKTKSKSKQSFDSHAIDAWVLAASVSGATNPTRTRLWYVVPAILHRRQLHRLQASTGGERKPYGGTRSLGLKRGTLVKHPKYGRCTVGGFDRRRQTISLHDYRTNKRLTQGARSKDCQVLTWVAWRSWFIGEKENKRGKKGTHPPLPHTRNVSFLPMPEEQGYPEAEV